MLLRGHENSACSTNISLFPRSALYCLSVLLHPSTLSCVPTSVRDAFASGPMLLFFCRSPSSEEKRLRLPPFFCYTSWWWVMCMLWVKHTADRSCMPKPSLHVLVWSPEQQRYELSTHGHFCQS